MKFSGADVIKAYLFKLRSRFDEAPREAARRPGTPRDDESHRGRDEKKREVENLDLVQNPVEFFSTECWFSI